MNANTATNTGEPLAVPAIGMPIEGTSIVDRLAAARRLLQARRPAEQVSASRWTNWYNR